METSDGASGDNKAKRRRVFASIGSGVGILAIVLIVALVHFSTASLPSSGFIHAAPASAAGPTPTLAPTPLLRWQNVSFPADFTVPGSAFPMALAPSDANTAYVCLTVRNNQPITPEIWVTHNRGASWHVVGHLPSSQEGECLLTVDATQPAAILATSTMYPSYNPNNGPPSPADASIQDFASVDGGVTWRSIGSGQSFDELATYQGTSYALRTDYTDNPADPIHLVASSNLQSWHTVDSDIGKAGDTVDSFWLNPTDGDILVHSFNGSLSDLWESSDGGQHWRQPAYPNLDPYTVAVQPPIGNEPWHLCVAQQILADPPHSYNLLACSNDGGQTWQQRPALNIMLTESILVKGDNQQMPYTPISAMNLIVLEADGSLLAAVDDASTATSTQPFGIYRLPPNSSHWQHIGRAPYTGGDLSFVPFTSDVIWFGTAYGDAIRSPYTIVAGDAYTTTYP